MFKDLNPLLHVQQRLAIMSILISVEEADFSYIKEKTAMTAGNLSSHTDKLSSAGYIDIIKGMKGKRPRTVFKITSAGIDAFEEYVNSIKTYINRSSD
ncbi:MAG: transcriptional regulator [Tannerellaceae bacterium]|jgi:DNA-binding MarR family transcriptional regulator|nr:transcriptional regulator [Tannerellaceae bacterium]